MTTASPVEGPLAHLYEGTLDCVHCGLCLPVCPTYRETGRETSSPRGRIYLMRGVAEGRIPLGDLVAKEAYQCLDCRACETACPSGVGVGQLIEQTRAAVEEAGLRHGPARRVERLALREILPHPGRLRLALDALHLAQRLRLDRLAARFLPARLRDLVEAAPRVPPRSERAPLPERIPARGASRGRVALFTGCVMPELFGAVNAATARVLAQQGFDVVIPPRQGCCGALHVHAGDPDAARELLERNFYVFEGTRVDAIVTNSAGCGAALREAGDLVGSPEAHAFSGRARDVCEFLDDAGLRPLGGRVEQRVCYDDPCHLVHAQGVRDAPRRLLEQIPGLELVAHDDPTSCCGAAGIYNMTHPEMSSAILERKLDALAAADPDVIATGNPGCLMQLGQGASRRGLRARVVHPVELLDRSGVVG